MKRPASKVVAAKPKKPKTKPVKPVPKKVAQSAVPSSERGALFAEEAFDAEMFAHRFRYGDFSGDSAAAITEARKDAVLSQKPRVLKWSTSSKSNITVLTVIFSSGSGHLPLQDKVHLWSLKQMVDFARALGATGTRRTRKAGLLPSPEAVCIRALHCGGRWLCGPLLNLLGEAPAKARAETQCQHVPKSLLQCQGTFQSFSTLSWRVERMVLASARFAIL